MVISPAGTEMVLPDVVGIVVPSVVAISSEIVAAAVAAAVTAASAASASQGVAEHLTTRSTSNSAVNVIPVGVGVGPVASQVSTRLSTSHVSMLGSATSEVQYRKSSCVLYASLSISKDEQDTAARSRCTTDDDNLREGGGKPVISIVFEIVVGTGSPTPSGFATGVSPA